MGKIQKIIITIIVAQFVFLACGTIPRKTLLEKYGKNGSQFIDIDGLKVHYRDQGTGPVLVLVHGIVSSLHTWDGWVKELSSKYRIIRFDLPGYGLTGPAKFKYVRENYMTFIHKFLSKLNVEKFYLAGNSLGGYLTWSYAVFYPEDVKKLILIDPAGYPQDVPGPVGLFTMPVIGSIGVRITPKFIFTHYVKQVYGDKKKIIPEVVDRYYNLMMHPGNRMASKEIFEELERNSVIEPKDVNKVSCPTLIMWGKKDSWIPVKLAKRFKKDISNSKLILYKGVGHVAMEEIPVLTAKDADAFIKGTKISTLTK